MDAAEERQAERAAATGLLRANSGGSAAPPKPSPPPEPVPERVITPEDFEPVSAGWRSGDGTQTAVRIRTS